MTAPPVTALPRPPMTGSAISALALADLLGHWPAADGPLYRLLATRIARLADTGELPAGLRLPAERDLAAVLSVSRNTVTAAYQVLRDEGMAESRQGAGTRIVPHRTTPAAVHRANGFFSGLLEDAVVEADLSLAAVDCAPQVAAALSEPDRPDQGRTHRRHRHLRLLPLRAAGTAGLRRRPPHPAAQPGRRPVPGHRYHWRAAGHRPADPLRGTAWSAGRGGGPDVPRRARRAAPGGRAGDRDTRRPRS